MTKKEMIIFWRKRQDQASEAMRDANRQPAWRKSARTQFDQALYAWRQAADELCALGDTR